MAAACKKQFFISTISSQIQQICTQLFSKILKCCPIPDNWPRSLGRLFQGLSKQATPDTQASINFGRSMVPHVAEQLMQLSNAVGQLILGWRPISFFFPHYLVGNWCFIPLSNKVFLQPFDMACIKSGWSGTPKIFSRDTSFWLGGEVYQKVGTKRKPVVCRKKKVPFACFFGSSSS